MCGISGFTRQGLTIEQSKEIVTRMCRLLEYRGPDDEGTFIDAKIALGHRRLSIIDLSEAGHQPMGSADSRYWITFNGEIYNYLELKKELAGRGTRFHTATDTEVILAAYQAYGDECVKHLNGMFAFALWDVPRQRLLLARDRLGKKPLYYFHHDKKFVFASEMKAILAMPGIPREIDYEALNLYLTFGYIPAPMSIFKHIRKVQAACILCYNDGQIHETTYWELPEPALKYAGTEEQAEEELEAILTDAVRCRMISDVPLGAFLSGGIDSSAIVAMMAKCDGQNAKTFTINFSEQAFSELEDAHRVANHFQTQHKTLNVTTDAVNLLPKLAWHFDEPFADSSAIPTYYVSKMAREHVTVILSGDGGDELFAGYTNYLKRDDHQALVRLPLQLRQMTIGKLAHYLPIQAPMRNFMKYVAAASRDDDPAAFGLFPYIKDDILTTPLRQEFKKYDARAPRQKILLALTAADKLTRLQFLDIKLYLPGDILVKVDRMSMANSLETRAPLLDYRLVEFAARLPAHLKIQNGVTKYLLKKVLQRYLPKEILTKRKHGFAVPIKLWFKTTLNGFTQQVLLDDRCRQRGFINPKIVQQMLKSHAQGRRDYSTWIWALLNLELWFQTFVDTSTRRI